MAQKQQQRQRQQQQQPRRRRGGRRGVGTGSLVLLSVVFSTCLVSSVRSHGASCDGVAPSYGESGIDRAMGGWPPRSTDTNVLDCCSPPPVAVLPPRAANYWLTGLQKPYQRPLGQPRRRVGSPRTRSSSRTLHSCGSWTAPACSSRRSAGERGERERERADAKTRGELYAELERWTGGWWMAGENVTPRAARASPRCFAALLRVRRGLACPLCAPIPLIRPRGPSNPAILQKNRHGVHANLTAASLASLWSAGDASAVGDLATLAFRLRALGFNAVRLPFSFADLRLPARNAWADQGCVKVGVFVCVRVCVM